jgi:uncharacterized protein DUF4142
MAVQECTMPNPQDLAFVQQATASGLAEVTEGNAAAQKSSILAVRNFGQRMVADQTGANNQLSAIAAQEHILQSPVPTATEQQDIVTLETLSDPEFTRTYLDMQVSTTYRRSGSSFRKLPLDKIRLCHRDRRNILRRRLCHDTCDPRELSVGKDGLTLARVGNSEGAQGHHGANGK